jgi:hypothetical protein
MRNHQKWTPHRKTAGQSELWGVVVDGDPEQVIVRHTTKLDGPDCQMIAFAHNAHLERGEDEKFWVKSLVNPQLQPKIQVSFGQEVFMLGAPEARGIVRDILEALEASMSDALLVRFLQGVVLKDLEDPKQVQQITGLMLEQFRDFRERLLHPTAQETEGEN